jgi:long-chain acyl-CoA synthetase
MQRTWLKNYPQQSGTSIDLNRYHSLPDLLEQTTERYSDNTAYINHTKSLSFNEISALSENFASFLQQKINIKKGDRVALMCPNTLPFVISMWGIIRCGAVQVSVNPMYSPYELKHQLTDAEVNTVIVFAPVSATLAEVIEQTKVSNVVLIEPLDLIKDNVINSDVDARLGNVHLFKDAITKHDGINLEPPKLNQQDIAFLQYTGGTTGLSKGAILTHGNLIANILQFESYANYLIVKGEETVITAIPMYHIFALSVNTLAYFSFGAKNILITDPRNMSAFVETWKNSPATVFTGVNTLFNGLLHTPGFSEIDFSNLRLSVGGGAPVHDAVSLKWKETTGHRIKEGYGLSETSPIVSLNLESGDNYISGIGLPIPETDVSLRNDQGLEVPQGESGELCVKGPQVMQGYWKNSEATKNAMTDDGYFKTGDIAEVDQSGYFHIVDRKKDMILVSGFNVFPNEIEAVVAEIPGVLESACIGIDDTKSGEVPALFVVKSDSSLTQEQIIEFCQKRLTAYKLPKRITFLEQLPKSSVGKLLRRKLRDKN